MIDLQRNEHKYDGVDGNNPRFWDSTLNQYKDKIFRLVLHVLCLKAKMNSQVVFTACGIFIAILAFMLTFYINHNKISNKNVKILFVLSLSLVLIVFIYGFSLSYDPSLQAANRLMTDPVIQQKENLPPTVVNLASVESSPQEVGATIHWTASASDPENDPIQYKFLLNSQPMTDWSYNPTWDWATSNADIGTHTIKAKVKDGKNNVDGDNTMAIDFTISQLNQPPEAYTLAADKDNPQNAGATITWEIRAIDPDDDRIFYKFFMNNKPVTDWTLDNRWTWDTTESEVGDNKIEVQIRDRKHNGPNDYDDAISDRFTLLTSVQTAPQVECTGADMGSYGKLIFCLPPEVVIEHEAMAEANYTDGREVAASMLLDGDRVGLHLLYPCQAPQTELEPAELKPYLEAYNPILAQATYNESMPGPVLRGQVGNQIFIAYQPNYQTVALVLMDINMSEEMRTIFLENFSITLNKDASPNSSDYCIYAEARQEMLVDQEAAVAKLKEAMKKFK